MIDFAQLKAAAQQTAAVADTSDRLPALGWRNGVKQVKSGGFFYVKDEALQDAPNPDIWTEANVYDNEVGYTAQRLNIACIGYRSQWHLEEDVGTQYPVKTWLTDWQQGARKFTEALVFVEGIDELLTWNIKGMASRAVTGKGGIFQQHKKFVDQIGATVGAMFSPWAFYMTVVTEHDVKGNPTYTDTGFKSWVTLPVLVSDPDEGTAEYASRQFVGAENYAEYTRLYHQHKAAGWFDQRRGNAPAPVIDDTMSRGEANGAAYEAGQADWSSDSPDDGNKAPF